MDVEVDSQETGANGAGACEDQGKPIDLDGTFVFSADLSFTFGSQPGGAVTVCPKHQTKAGLILGLVRMSHSPGATQAQLSVLPCNLQLPMVSAMAGTCEPSATNLVSAGIVFPKRLIEVIPTVTSGKTWAKMQVCEPGGAFSTGKMDFSVGTNNPLETAAQWKTDAPGCGINDNHAGRTQGCEETCVTDCASLRDDDGDDWPGVSVFVCGYTPQDIQDGVVCHGEEPNQAGATIQGRALMNLFINQAHFAGTVHSSCEVSGTLDANIVYHLVGADVYVANSQISVTSAIKSLPTYQLVPSESRFRMVRVDGRFGARNWPVNWSNPGPGCAESIARVNELD